MFARGELVDYFTARNPVQSLDDCGTGCLVESKQILKIVALSKRLCRALDYEGMAEIEYKYDSESREFRLIEINTRHWDWHRLGSASGINLSWTAYCDLTGRSLDSGPKPVTRAKWIAEDALLIYMLRPYRRRLRVRDVWRNLQAAEFSGISDWSDPRPGLHYLLREFFRELARSFMRLASGRAS